MNLRRLGYTLEIAELDVFKAEVFAIIAHENNRLQEQEYEKKNMAAGVEDPFKIDSDWKDATHSVQKFADNASASLAKVEGAFSALKAVAVAAVAVLTTGEIVSFLKNAASAAAEGEDSISGLNAAMKLSGNFTQEASAGFIALADSMQKTTKFTDDQVLKSVKLAQSYDLTNEQTQKLVKGAADLAAITGEDLGTATLHLAQTLDGTTGRLKEQIPELGRMTKAQLEAGGAIDFVAGRFKGAAEAAGQTFSGRITITKNAFEDLQKTIGRLITQNPLINKFIKDIGSAFNQFAAFIDKNSVAIEKFITGFITGIVNSVPIAIEVFRRVVQVIGFAVKGIELLALGALGAVTAFGEFDFVNKIIATIVQALALAGAGVLELVRMLATLPGVSQGLKILGVDVESLASSLDKTNEKIFKFVDSVDSSAVKQNIQKIAQGIVTAKDKTDVFFSSADKGLLSLKDKTLNYASVVEKVGRTQVKVANDASAAIAVQTKRVQELTKAERAQALTALAGNPIGGLFGQVELPKGTDKTTRAIGIGAGFAQSALGGAEGAKKLVGGLAAAAGDALLPGLGAVVGPLAEALSAGPEKVKAMVTEFVKAIPTLIINIVKALPVLVTELIKGLLDAIPDLIEGLIEAIPEFIGALVEATPQIIEKMVTLMPRVVGRFAEKFLQIPGDFLQKLLDGIKEGLKKVFDFIFSDDNGVLGTGLGGKRGLFGTGLFNFHGGGFGLGGDKGLLGGGIIPGFLKAGGALSGPSDNQPVVINMRVGEAQLAQAILNINRQGFRTA